VFWGALMSFVCLFILVTPQAEASTRIFFGVIIVFPLGMCVRSLMAFSVTFAGEVVLVRTSLRTRKFDLARVEQVVAVPRVVVGRRRDVLGLVMDGETRVFPDISQPLGRPGIVDDVARELDRRKGLSAQ
jgi:hypothetical protein